MLVGVLTSHILDGLVGRGSNGVANLLLVLIENLRGGAVSVNKRRQLVWHLLFELFVDATVDEMLELLSVWIERRASIDNERCRFDDSRCAD